MKLTFLGKNTTSDHSPTLYATDRGTYVVQGWKITDGEALAQMGDVPADETAVEVPKALMEHLAKDTPNGAVEH